MARRVPAANNAGKSWVGESTAKKSEGGAWKGPRFAMRHGPSENEETKLRKSEKVNQK